MGGAGWGGCFFSHEGELNDHEDLVNGPIEGEAGGEVIEEDGEEDGHHRHHFLLLGVAGRG